MRPPIPDSSTPNWQRGIRRVKEAKRIGVRLGNWLTAEQSRALLGAPDVQNLKGLRDRAMLALMLGCGLRRGEVADQRIDHLQQREDHWVIADLVGKTAHIRTVPLPDWVKSAVDAWTSSAPVTEGRLFRCVSRMGSVWGKGITEKVIWHVVKASASAAGIAKFSLHDCRRTCARRCHATGGQLEQIQFLLATSR
jgi:integrase